MVNAGMGNSEDIQRFLYKDRQDVVSSPGLIAYD